MTETGEYRDGEKCALAVVSRWARRNWGVKPGAADWDDIDQTARFAAWKASQRWVRGMGSSLRSWMATAALGEVKRLFRDGSHLTRRRYQEVATGGAEVSEADLPPVPFSSACGEGDDGRPLSGNLDRPDPAAERAFDLAVVRADLERALAVLSERDRQLLIHTVGLGLSQEETGAIYGLTQMGVSHAVKRAIKEARKAMGAEAGAGELTARERFEAAFEAAVTADGVMAVSVPALARSMVAQMYRIPEDDLRAMLIRHYGDGKP